MAKKPKILTSQTLRERFSRKKTIWLVLCTMILTIVLCAQPVSAFEWDNVGFYDSETRTMTIRNALGFGDVIAKMRLVSEPITKVMPGKDRKVAEIEFYDFDKEYGKALKKMEFFNKKGNNQKFNRNFKYKYQNQIGTRQRPTYETTCEGVGYHGNGTEIIDCTTTTSYETVGVYEWVEFNSLKDVPNGNVSIGIFTNVYEGDSVEWIPTFFGVEIDEWATWQASASDGLIAWYTLEESSGRVVEDIIHSLNATVNGTTITQGVDGLINNAYSFSSANKDHLTINDTTTKAAFNFSTDGSNLANFSISLWMNKSGTGGGALIDRSTGAPSPMWSLISDAGENIDVTLWESDGTQIDVIGSQSIPLDEWAHVVMVANGTHVSTFINGTFVQKTAYDGTIRDNDAVNISFANNEQGGGSFFDGRLDEIGIWNRSLTASEVSNLYNNGIGLNPLNETASIEEEFGITVLLNTPTDSLEFVEATRLFNSTITPSSGNLTLKNSTFNIWFSNNTLFNSTFQTMDATSNETTFTPQDIVLDSYAWNVLSCGENTTSTICSIQAANFTFERAAFSVDSDFFFLNNSETESRNFHINISTIESILSVSANLVYNGTKFIASSSCNASGFCFITRDIDIPLVDSAESANKTFFWEISVFDGTTTLPKNTSVNSHRVNRIHLEECNATFVVNATNFTAFDEANLTRIRNWSFKGTFDYWFGSGTVKQNTSINQDSILEENLCIKPNGRTFNTDAQIEYGDAFNTTMTSYVTRNYFFSNASLTNTTQHIQLFLLNSLDSTSFIIKVQDANTNPVEDAFVSIQRFYPGDGIFRTVQIIRTDGNGESIGFYKTETVDYKHIIVKNGIVELITGRQKIFGKTTPFTLIFTIGAGEGAPWDVFENQTGISTSLSFNETNKIVSFSYIDTTGVTAFGRLLVEKPSLSNGTSTIICDVNSSIASSTLTCNVTGFSGTLVAKGYVINDSTLANLITFIITTAKEIFGKTGIIIGWFVILVAAMAFIWNPTAGIISTNAAIIFVSMIGLITFNPIFTYGILGVSILLIILMKT